MPGGKLREAVYPRCAKHEMNRPFTLYKDQEERSDMKCPSCGGRLYTLDTSSDPEGIRQDVECGSCSRVFAVTKGALVRLNDVERRAASTQGEEPGRAFTEYLETSDTERLREALYEVARLRRRVSAATAHLRKGDIPGVWAALTIPDEFFDKATFDTLDTTEGGPSE